MPPPNSRIVDRSAERIFPNPALGRESGGAAEAHNEYEIKYDNFEHHCSWFVGHACRLRGEPEGRREGLVYRLGDVAQRPGDDSDYERENCAYDPHAEHFWKQLASEARKYHGRSARRFLWRLHRGRGRRSGGPREVDHQAYLRRQTGLLLAAGQGAYSDPVPFKVNAFEKLSLSLDVQSAADISTHHVGLRTNWSAAGARA